MTQMFVVAERSTHDSIREKERANLDTERARAIIANLQDLGHPARQDAESRRAVLEFLRTHDSRVLGNWEKWANSIINIANKMQI